jgi:hypothetical protein
LRGSRKNINQPYKITKIILPILNRNDWLENNNNQDLKKVREIIYQMGLEDETISQKVKVFNIEIEKQKEKQKPTKDNNQYYANNDFGEYDEELTTNLKLKTLKRTILGITFEKAKKIIVNKNIRSKEEYFELCKKDDRLTTEPEIVFKGTFTNWIDYLSIPRVYYNLEMCKLKISELLLLNKNIINYFDLLYVCKELCKLDSNFPPFGLWVEYYNITDLRDIIIINSSLNKKKKTGIIL